MSDTLLSQLRISPVELGFGTSGLRGLVRDMTDLECYINSRGFLDYLISINDIGPGSSIALAGDLRDSTPRITQSILQAIQDAGCKAIYLGSIPIPAAAYYGKRHGIPVAMVTGSHIPVDRNGIKFYKSQGEVLKKDEKDVKQAVARARKQIYNRKFASSLFDERGSLRKRPVLPPAVAEAADKFIKRYTSVFKGQPLKLKKVIIYQHSSVAAEMLVKLLEQLGAAVIPVDKSSKFIPIDTENITPDNRSYFKSLAKKYPDNFAIVSCDGDSDRPFVVDETGNFHRGDVLGALVAEYIGARLAVVPVSASDAVDRYLAEHQIKLTHTKIGSPYVIAAMAQAAQKGLTPVVGWEVNGGFLTGSDIKINDEVLESLATRDAFLPIVCVLVQAAQNHFKMSELFRTLPQRFTQAGLLDNFPSANSQAILNRYSEDTMRNRSELEGFFKPEDSFGKVVRINSLDGVRIVFNNNDIAHIRPSGNAPQLRIYSVADSQKRADEIVRMAIAEPRGILRLLEKSTAG